MTERMIFLNALERDTAAARSAYLDKACAGRPALRRRVEELLRSHDAIQAEEANAFLEVPAMEQMEAANQSLAFLKPPGEANSLGRLDYYEVLEVIGRGSTGMVLRAKDTKLQRVVAIKVLAPALAASPKARQRLVHEAQATAAVRDDHVVALHAVNDEGPVPYLVMDYVHGITLEECVQKAGGGLELKEILRIGLQVAKGLAAAHAQGLVHRDIKPANILLENSVQRVKITDFGLASAAADATRTNPEIFAGTPLYASPEQACGGFTDQRTDLFSLGSVLYVLCTGRSPFWDDNTPAVLKHVCEDSPRPIREINPAIPDWLERLIDKLLAKSANDRFASAQEVADLLGRRLAQAQTPVPPAVEAPAMSDSPVAGGERPARRKGFPLVLGLATLVVVLGSFLIFWHPWRTRPPEDANGGSTKGNLPSPVSLDLRREDVPPAPGPFAVSHWARRFAVSPRMTANRPAPNLPSLKQQTALPPALLVLAGGGDPAKAPPELAAVLGDGKYLLPRVGQAAWMENSPDGKLLGVPLDEDVLLFDVMTGAYLRTLKGPGGRVFRVTFSRDSQLLAAITRNEERGGSVQVWDLGANRVLFTNPRPGPAGFCSAAFSGDGERLFTEGNGRVCVWDSRSGARIQEVEIHPQGVGPMCVSPDGRRLAVANFFEGSVKVFDWDGKNLKEVRTLKGHSSLVAGVAFSPNGKFLATGDTDEVKLWKADTLELIRSVKTPAQELAFAPDSQTLFAAATNAQSKPAHKVTRWDVSTWTELPALTVDVSVEPVCAFHCLRRDGKVLFMVSQHAATHVRAIDTGTGKDLNPRIGHVAPLHVVAISPNGRTAASAGEDCVVKLWDLATGRVHHSGNAHTGPVYGLAFSPDGELLASGSRDGTIALWDVARGAVVRALLGHSRSYSRIQFSPDGTTLAAGNDRGTIKTWDVATGQEGRSLPGHSGEVRAVAFSPDGKWLASGGEDRIVRLHELTSGRSRSFQATISVCEIAISPDGRTLAAVGEAPKAGVQLWDGCANSFW